LLHLKGSYDYLYGISNFTVAKYLTVIKAASSALADLGLQTAFQPVLGDPILNEDTAKRVVLLSGKIYYDLVKERLARGLDGRVSFVRIEELSPFPFAELGLVLARLHAANEFFWLQEEPRNQGAYSHVSCRIDSVLESLGHGKTGRVTYRGRKESAVPAPGIGCIYTKQQRSIIDAAFKGL
jgi:probable 2-oxoglutarate dehydrogenase E1 component DHKTD1